MRKISLVILFVILLVVFMPKITTYAADEISAESRSLTATTYYVRVTGTGTACTSSNPCNLQTALNLSSNGDIVLVGKHPFDAVDYAQSFSIDNKAITIEGRFILIFQGTSWIACSGSNCPTIKPPAGSSGFTIDLLSTQAITLRGINIEDADGASAVWVESGTLMLENCTFTNNKHLGGDGGGLRVDSGASAEIDNCHFESNSARNGGAISNFGSTEVDDSSFRFNSASYGGAIFSENTVSNLIITNSLLQQNAATSSGGAIRQFRGTTSLTNTDIFTNTAGLTGGGLDFFDVINVTATGGTIMGNEVDVQTETDAYGGGISQKAGIVTLTNVDIRNNSASSSASRYGGGISVRRFGIMTINDSTLSDNEVLGIFPNSSAIYVLDATVNINDSTISKHHGAIFIDADIGSSLLDIRRSTLHDNTTSVHARNENTTVNITNSTISQDASIGSNILVQGDGDVNLRFSTLVNIGTSGIAINKSESSSVMIENSIISGDCSTNGGDIIWDSASIYDNSVCRPGNSGGFVFDLRLSPLRNFGGPTMTHHPESNSAALNRGGLVGCLAPGVAGKDQRDFARPFGTACDVGSVEYHGSPTAIRLRDVSAETPTPIATIIALMLTALTVPSIRRSRK